MSPDVNSMEGMHTLDNGHNNAHVRSPHLTWSDALLLGDAAMDAEHREFVQHVLALQAATPDTVQQRLTEFAAHARHHFDAEDRRMDESQFPPRHCHQDEHAAVLKSVAEVQALVAAGRSDIVRGLADELARWFPGHVHHLDSALAAWLCKLRFDAKPLVLRRSQGANIASSANIANIANIASSGV